jgi:transketolase
MQNRDLVQKSMDIAKISRKKAVQMTSQAKSSHIGSCFSVMDILSVLFTLKQTSEEHSKDEIILSKGHAAAALYAVLDSHGLLNSNLDDFCKDNSHIYGHINHEAGDQIPLSTGSLGHGLPFGLGISLANKLKKLTCKTFVVISDGELNEGTTWESALFAGHHKLSNLVVVIDRNRIQSLGFTEDTLKLDPISDKWESFGWKTIEINGHDYNEILNAALLETSKPLCIVANTVKGKGVSFMENTIEWHYKSANENELTEAITQIERGFP